MNLPSTSAIPGALANLLAIATAVLPAETTVWFGAELPAFSAALTFQITEITGDQQPAELGNNYRREENFAFVCSLTSYTGGAQDYANTAPAGQGFVVLLQAVMADFALLAQAIANNPRLTFNGTDAVRIAEVGNFHLHPETDDNGQSFVTLDFAVRCAQRVTSLT